MPLGDRRSRLSRNGQDNRDRQVEEAEGRDANAAKEWRSTILPLAIHSPPSFFSCLAKTIVSITFRA
jgi:hypothetical protein